MKCFLCNKSNLKVVYRLKDKKILACENDGLFIVENNQNKDLYDHNYYDQNPYPSSPGLNERYFQNKLDKIVKLMGKTNLDILDWGCGWGNFLEVVKKNNMPYLGVDSSSQAIKICRSKALNCKNVSINQLIETRCKFSCITCFQVLEHMQQPVAFLSSLKKILKPNGILLATTPNNESPLRKLLKTKWPVYNTKSHFVFYNKTTLKKTFEAVGFKNIMIAFDSPRFMSLSYIISRIFSREFKFLDNISIPTDPFGDLELIYRK